MIRGRRKRAAEPVKRFEKWSVTTTMSDGSVTILDGWVYSNVDPAEALRYVTALRDGLRAAGFDAELTLIHESVEVQP